MTAMHTRLQQGFTLVELLVVVMIISLLVALGVRGFGDAFDQADDTARMRDLHTIAAALEQYRIDHGIYPPETHCDTSIGSYGSSCSEMINTNSTQDGWDTTSNFYQAMVGGGYVADLPTDPQNNDSFFYYYEPTNGNEPSLPNTINNQGYLLRTRMSDGSLWGVCGGVATEHATWCAD